MIYMQWWAAPLILWMAMGIAAFVLSTGAFIGAALVAFCLFIIGTLFCLVVAIALLVLPS